MFRVLYFGILDFIIMDNEKLTKNTKKFISTNPPQKLAELIEMMNFVPWSLQLPDAGEKLEESFQNLTGTTASAEWIVQNAFYEKENLFVEEFSENGVSLGCLNALCTSIEIIRQTLGNYPMFIKNILPESLNSGMCFEVWEMYEEYFRLRTEFASIVSHLEQFRKYDFDKSKIPFNTAFNLSTVAATFDFDENGKVTFQNSFLIQALEGADVRRLRLCDVCQAVLWAYRSNTRFCSKKCADVYFQRQQRSNVK